MGHFCRVSWVGAVESVLGIVCFGGFGVYEAEAKLLKIIHTNDLHSHLEHSQDLNLGSYAAVKSKIDNLKTQAAIQGMDTLVLDAGDFTEGTQFFLADQGEQSWRVMDAMGYDAVALGNHDYLMGQPDLNRILGHVRPSFPVLAANFDLYDDLPHLKKYIKPYVQFHRAGAYIAVLGVTTDDFAYQWRAGDLVIDSPKEGVKKYIQELRAKNDFVFVLSHIGMDADQALARDVPGIDLIVGGHSHTKLTECASNFPEVKEGESPRIVSPCSQRNAWGFDVPIVQAGEHGEFVGELDVDLDPKNWRLKAEPPVLNPVQVHGPSDPHVSQLVGDARKVFEDQYGNDWLHEVVAQSEVPLETPKKGPTAWGNVVAEALRDAGGAHISVDTSELFGDNMASGPVTREQLFQFYPRVFGFKEKYGWNVWTVKVYGWVLKWTLEIAMHRGIVFNIGGASFDVVGNPGDEELQNFVIAGKKFEKFKSYKVALPEGIGRAVSEIDGIYSWFFRSPKDTGVSVWAAIEARLRKIGGVVKSPTEGIPARVARIVHGTPSEAARVHP